MKKYFIITAVLLAAGCSSCSSSANNVLSVKDGGTDTDTDSDTDTDTDSDTDTDTDTDTGGNISDAGPWDWTDLPQSEDCGSGCTQLTFKGRIKAWDIWDNMLVYEEYLSGLTIVDIKKHKHLTLPPPPPPFDSCKFNAATKGNCLTKSAGIYNGIVYYSLFPFEESNIKKQHILVQADIVAQKQTILWALDENEKDWSLADDIDVYGTNVISTGGCDQFIGTELCYFNLLQQQPDGSVTPKMLLGESYGGANSIWGNVAVWFTWADFIYDIQGYNFETQKVFQVTQDDECQLYPRIQGTKVAYMDLRNGEGCLAGNWNHSAIFVHDIVTKQTTQITNGQWIGAHPDVYGNIVIWSDYRDTKDPNYKDSLTGVEVWGYNLNTKKQFQITHLPQRAKTHPRIWGDKVYVEMSSSNGGGIYMFDLPPEAFETQ